MYSCFAIALLFATASPLAAQGGEAGTATFQMTVHLPDSLKGKLPIPIGGDLDMQMKYMMDGRRVAMEMAPGALTPMLAGMRIRMTFTLGTDTMHVGILLAPEMAAAGGSAGSRLDIPVSMLGAASPLLGSLMDSTARKMIDSLGKTPPVYHSLGTSATVAGMACEEWEAVRGTDTTRTCVIPTPRGLLALQEQFKTMTGLQNLMAQMPGLADMQKQAYGGREMTAIRTINVKMGIRMELTSFTPGVPDATQLALPDGLTLMPMPALPTKPGGGGRQR